MNQTLHLYNAIWNKFLEIGFRVFWHSPFWNDFSEKVIGSEAPSKNFIENHRNRHNFQIWLDRCILEGVPIIDSYYTGNIEIDSQAMFPSIGEVSAMLLEIGLETPLIRSKYFYNDVLYLQPLVLNLIEAALQPQRGEEGIIIVMDMTKSTPYIFKAENSLKPGKELSNLLHCLHQIGAVIKAEGFLMGSINPRYWVTEGDKFIGFIPFSEVPYGRRMLSFFEQLQNRLLQIKKSAEVSFKVGAHWGNLLTSGGVIQSNSEIIKATRVMEFSKREGIIIISEIMKKKIVGDPPSRDLEVKFDNPMVLLEGKPNKWIRPEELTISITDEEEIRLYEIKI